MAIEVVILAPVLIAVMMLIVGLGRYVDRRGDVEAMARDAVRSASLQRDAASARQAAQAIVDSTRPSGVTCTPVQLGGTFAPGEIISVQVRCTVSFNGLGFVGFPGDATLEGESFAPIDELRRTS
jgi:Flp pilus assembly protein TadG